MLVLAKELNGEDYTNVQNRFANHWAAIGSIRDMMMVEANLDGKPTICLLLPNNNSTPAYSDFKEINESDLPGEATLLVGYHDDFEKRFRFPTRI